jgi:hypothetical protein
MDDSSKRRLHAADFHCLLCSLQNFMAHTAALHWCSTERVGREDGEKVERRGREKEGEEKERPARGRQYAVTDTSYTGHRIGARQTKPQGAAQRTSTAQPRPAQSHHTTRQHTPANTTRGGIQSRADGKGRSRRREWRNEKAEQ